MTTETVSVQFDFKKGEGSYLWREEVRVDGRPIGFVAKLMEDICKNDQAWDGFDLEDNLVITGQATREQVAEELWLHHS